MSRHYPHSPEPKITPLAPIKTPIVTGDEARAQMLEDSKITRGNVLGAMDIPDSERAQMEAALAMFSQMLIGALDDDDALETFSD